MNTHTVLKGFFALGLYLGIASSSIAGTQMTKDGIKFPDNTEQTTAVPTPVGGNVDQILKSGGSTGKYVWTEMSGGGAPMGMIAMWSGTISNIPTGWVICDGNNGTPNLTDKFIKASSTAGSTGGSNTHSHGHNLQGGAHTLTVAQMPSHNHPAGKMLMPGGDNDYESGPLFYSFKGGYSVQTLTLNGLGEQPYLDQSVASQGGNSSHAHPVSGSINSGSNEPEYYSLLFIMKVAPNATPEEPLGTAIVSGTEPTTASLGALWYDTVPNQLKAKINTGWEVIGEKPNLADLGGTTISTSDPVSNDTGKTTGHLWINKANGQVFILSENTSNMYYWISLRDSYANITPYMIASGGSITCVNSTDQVVACSSETGMYKVHTFNSSGTFTVTNDGANPVVDWLVLASGGQVHSGGAGGYRTSYGAISGGGCAPEDPISVSSQSYDVIVGTSGNSSALGITSFKGGSSSGGSGGSGAARLGDDNLQGSSGGSGTICQGYAGAGSSNYSSTTGSGGGAAGAGSGPGWPYDQRGGLGITTNIDGLNLCRGEGGTITNATRVCGGGAKNVLAIANRGGGTGYYNLGSGQPAGSGVVIIRYRYQ